jgi:hypothetical protein
MDHDPTREPLRRRLALRTARLLGTVAALAAKGENAPLLRHLVAVAARVAEDLADLTDPKRSKGPS